MKHKSKSVKFKATKIACKIKDYDEYTIEHNSAIKSCDLLVPRHIFPMVWCYNINKQNHSCLPNNKWKECL